MNIHHHCQVLLWVVGDSLQVWIPRTLERPFFEPLLHSPNRLFGVCGLSHFGVWSCCSLAWTCEAADDKLDVWVIGAAV